MSGSKPEARNVKTRRGYKGRYQVEKKATFIGVNANGVSSKLPSLDYIMVTLNPEVMCIQEMKFRIKAIKRWWPRHFFVWEN